MTEFLNNLLILSPEAILTFALLIFITIGAINSEKYTAHLYIFTIALMFILGIVSLFSLGDGKQYAFAKQFVVHDYIHLSKSLIFFVTAALLVIVRDYFKHFNIDRFELPVLIVFAVLGMTVLVSSNSLLTFYLGLELQSLTLYVLASFHRDNLQSTESGLKYFVLGALASGLFLYGCSLVYGFTGLTNFTDLAAFFERSTDVNIGALVGFVFVLAGLAFKVSAVPFHMWTPDVYEGAPTPVTAFFATTTKLTAILVLLRVVFEPFETFLPNWQPIIIALSILSMIFASVAAIAQKTIKRLLAYSSIGHVGYLLIGVAAGTELSLQAVMTYLIIYVIMNLGVFGCLLVLRQQGRMVERLEDFAGLMRTNPVVAIPLSIFMFSMAGIPPLAGFFAKFYIFMAAIEAQLYYLAVLGVIASVIGAYYYLRVVKLMMFDEPIEQSETLNHKPSLMILFATAGFNILFIIYPSLFSGIVEQAIISLT